MVGLGLPFTGSVVCHTLPLFGKSTLGIISFDFLYDSFTRALPLLSFTVLSGFTLIPSTISRRAVARDNTGVTRFTQVEVRKLYITWYEIVSARAARPVQVSAV